MERQTGNGTHRRRGRPAGTREEREAIAVANGILEVNQVTVDPVALTAEAQTVAAEATAEATQAAADLPPTPDAIAQQQEVENAEEGYRMLSVALVSQGAELWCPNWHITPLETTDLSNAIVQALMLWFPDGLLPPKYMAILVIAGVGFKIVGARSGPNGLPPRHAPIATQTAQANGADPHSYVAH